MTLVLFTRSVKTKLIICSAILIMVYC